MLSLLWTIVVKNTQSIHLYFFYNKVIGKPRANSTRRLPGTTAYLSIRFSFTKVYDEDLNVPISFIFVMLFFFIIPSLPISTINVFTLMFLGLSLYSSTFMSYDGDRIWRRPLKWISSLIYLYADKDILKFVRELFIRSINSEHR